MSVEFTKVSVQDAYGNTATGYAGTVTFTSTDTSTNSKLPSPSPLIRNAGNRSVK